MSVWDTYITRSGVNGRTARDRALQRSGDFLTRKLPNSLSWHDVFIDGLPQTAAILNLKEDVSIKRICSMPGEHLKHGGLVDFADSKWLITETDACDEVYASGTMRRCNHQLRWLNKCGRVIEKWCVVEDGTKYLIGEKQSGIMSIGDARIAVTIAKDADTNELGRGKRFLIDDIDSEEVLAYQITKPNKLFNVYNGDGVFRFIMNEVNLTDNDNVKLRIADYYSWQPDRHPDNEHRDKDIPLKDVIKEAVSQTFDDEKEVWL